MAFWVACAHDRRNGIRLSFLAWTEFCACPRLQVTAQALQLLTTRNVLRVVDNNIDKVPPELADDVQRIYDTWPKQTREWFLAKLFVKHHKRVLEQQRGRVRTDHGSPQFLAPGRATTHLRQCRYWFPFLLLCLKRSRKCSDEHCFALATRRCWTRAGARGCMSAHSVLSCEAKSGREWAVRCPSAASPLSLGPRAGCIPLAPLWVPPPDGLQAWLPSCAGLSSSACMCRASSRPLSSWA